MRIVRYGSPRAFLDAAEPFLLGDEAMNNLLLSVPARLAARGPDAWSGVHFAAAFDGDAVVGAAMRTPPYRLVLSQAPPVAVRAMAEDAATLRPPPPGIIGPDGVVAEFAALWRALTGESGRAVLHERIHRLDAVRPVPAVPGRMRHAAGADRPLLLRWLHAFAAETFAADARPAGEAERVLASRLETPGEGLALWDDGEPRCLVGFGGPTRDGIRIGPVYTPPDLRGRGYATACVAEVSGLLLRQGRRFCMLYTDLANPTSNRIYRRIGYEPLGTVTEYRFEREGPGVSAP